MSNKSTRRQFIQRCAATTVALPFFVNAKAFGANDCITMGFIGMGGRGRGDLNAFMSFKDVRALAVCDVVDAHTRMAKQQVNRQARVNVRNRFAVITARFDPKATGIDQITITADGRSPTYSYENAEGELTTLAHDRPLLIGRQPGREARHFKGDLAGILLYNRALSDEELNSTARWLSER